MAGLSVMKPFAQEQHVTQMAYVAAGQTQRLDLWQLPAIMKTVVVLTEEKKKFGG